MKRQQMIFGLVYACPGVNKSGWGIVLPHNRRKLLRSQFGQFLLRLLPQFRNRHRIKDSRGKKGSGNPEADDAVADRIDDAPVRRAEVRRMDDPGPAAQDATKPRGKTLQ